MARMPGKKYTSKKSLANRVKALESNVNSQETKRHVTVYNEASVPNTTALTIFNTINSMTTGDGADNVDGRQYALTGIAYKFLVHNQTAVDQLFRMCIIRTGNQTITSAGESLFLGAQSNGLNFSSATETQKYYLPLNRRKYDVIFEDTFVLGKSNAGSTQQYFNNKICNGYKRFKNKKESMNASGSPDTRYYFLAWNVDANMDANSCELELSGQTTVYFHDN